MLRFLALVALITASTLAQAPEAKPAPAPAAAPKPSFSDTPVVRHHEFKLASRTLSYTTTTGYMPIRNAQGLTEAHIFYIAYTLDGLTDPSKRRLMFSFNGGPGSSSVWLHLGALGPKRVKMLDDGALPPPPYRLVPNEDTWLTHTDLVFIDPVGTGYSRPEKPDLQSKFSSRNGDIESVGEFIRLYLSRHKRWASPLFLVGESYGTTRAAGFAGYLVDRGIAFNWNRAGLHHPQLPNRALCAWQRPRLSPDLAGIHRKAWYHKALPADSTSLAMGDRLSPDELKERDTTTWPRRTSQPSTPSMWLRSCSGGPVKRGVTGSALTCLRARMWAQAL